MTLPGPMPGLVIRYAFLWSAEAERGSFEASKERPCAIVVATYNKDGSLRTVVAPITHTPPLPGEEERSLEISQDICRRLGLDSQSHWVRLDELNRFQWPDYDLRPRPDDPERWDYGMLPREFFERLRSAIIELDRKRKNRIVTRD